MRKRILSFLLAFVMLVGMVPIEAVAVVPASVEDGVIYQNGTDDSNWPFNGGYVKSVTLEGASINSYVWNGNECDVVLATDTATDASVTFKIAMEGAPQLVMRAGITIDGVNQSSAKKGKVKLVDGKKDVDIVVTVNNVTATKTFHLSIAGGGVKNDPPALKDGVNATATSVAYTGCSYNVNLADIFTDPDGNNLTYTVKEGKSAAKTIDKNYNYIPEEAGTMSLVFTANDGKLDSPAYTVNLTVLPSDLTLDKKEAEVEIGKTLTLNAAVSPETAGMVWTSSDSSVATVEDGVVTPLKEGTTDITVSAAGKSLKCTVNVIDPSVLRAKVTMTINNQGTLDLIREPVTVVDQDHDGVLTFHDALVVLHNTYGKSYIAEESSYGLFVTTMWDVQTGGSCYFLIDNVPLAYSVGTDTVKDGDNLYATCMKDIYGFSDVYTYFGTTSKTVTAGEEFDLTLYALAMNWETYNRESVPAGGISVGTYNGNFGGSYTSLGKNTDANGKVSLSFDEPGTYIVSATGNYVSNGMESPIMPPVCVVTVKEATVERVEMSSNTLTMTINTSDKLTATVFPSNAVNKTLTWTSSDATVVSVDKNGNIKAKKEGTATITATASNGKKASCVVTVELAEPAEDAVISMTIGNRGVLSLVNASVTVKDLNSDGILTYDEALEAAHTTYFDGENGFAINQDSGWVYKLWGVESSNLLFFRNDKPIPEFTNSRSSVVKTGDALYATILMYDSVYKDVYSAFDQKTVTTKVGQKLDLVLTGYLGAHNGQNPTWSPVGNAAIGTWSEGTFTAIEDKVTDADGKVSLSFDTAGTYIVSAYKNEISSPLIAPVCVVHVEEDAVEEPIATEYLSALKFAAGTSATAAEYELQPAFDPGVKEYTLVVPDSKTTVAVWATLAKDQSGSIKAVYKNTSNSNKTVTVTSAKTTGASLSSVLKTGFGGNTVTITVGGEEAYVITIVRKATLSSLTLTSGDNYTAELDPVFNADKVAYTARVPYNQTLTVIPKAKISSAAVTINGAATTEITPVWTGLNSEVVIVVDGGESYPDVLATTYTVDLNQCATGIEVLTPPTKTEYSVGDKFDPAGMTLKATYSDGTTETIAKDRYTYAPDDGLYPGVEAIEVKFDGLSVKQAITMATIFEGEGTEEVPYLIKTAEDLVKLSDLVSGGLDFSGVYFKMVNDITLPVDWTPLGTSSTKPFSGNFDGGNKLLTIPEGGLPLIGTPAGATLSNLNIYGSKIAGYGVVNNYTQISAVEKSIIVIDNVTLKSGTQTLKSGFIGGYASGQDIVTIQNCTVEKGVIIGYDKQQSNIGSFGGDYNGTIENCASSAIVYGVNFVGGIVGGKGQTMGDFIVKGCVFDGTVAATGNYVGGIVGHGYTGTGWNISSAPNAPMVTIQNCTCSGNITGADYVGGILGAESGIAQVWENGIGYIQSNRFTGKVFGGSYVGGIIGYIRSLNKYTVIIDNYYAGTCGASAGIGGVQYVDTNCQSHETASGATYLNTENGTTDCPKIQYCSWKKAHNRTDDPMGVDAGKLCHTDTHIEPIAIELKVSGTYKTEYIEGEKLDLTGIQLDVIYNDNSTQTVKLKDVTVKGYDKNQIGKQTVTLVYGSLSADITVVVKPDGKFTVTISVLGDKKHNSDVDGKVHTLVNGNLTTWIGPTKIELEGTVTVKEVLERVLNKAGMSYKNPTGNYVESINGIGEFTNGANSGWMYTLNGTHPNLGVAEQIVKNDDVIVFHYTDDYTKESGNQGYGDRDEAAAEKVEKLIDDIGTVTLNSKNKIEAARKEFDSLSYTQKLLVDNYKKLTDAESKYAELKKLDDEKKADAVEKLIDQLDSKDTSYEKDIKAAKEAYDALTSDQKKLVENYEKLVAALKDVASEEDKKAAENVEKLIESIGTVTKDSKKKIKAAREAYDKLTDEQKVLVENLTVLEEAEERLEEIKNLAEVENIYKTTGDYLEKLGTPSVGTVGGEWMVIGLIRSGRQIKNADDYYETVVKFVQENIDENGRLHNTKSTENSRIILALTAMGKDVTNVANHNLLAGLNDMEYVCKQGINGPIWALITLDSGNYSLSEGDVTREALIQIILDAQLEDGGWALGGSVSDPDMTGMALQALTTYYEKNAEVKKAVDEAIEMLSMMQGADGSFASIDGCSSESIAQVVTALSGLGIDVDRDSRFIKNGVSALDALCTFYVEGGGFKHILDGKLDGMATEQSYYALTAYFHMQEGKPNLFDMTDVVDMGNDKVEEVIESAETPTKDNQRFPWMIVVVIVVLASAVVVPAVVSKSKKHKINK